MHNGFVNIEKEKMSKSVGNVLLVHNLLDDAPGEAIRLALLNGHYRQPLDWTAEALKQSKAMLDRLYGALRALQDVEAEASHDTVPAGVMAALLDDLNTPKALSELFALAKQANQAETLEDKVRLKQALLSAGQLMGLLGQDADAWFEEGTGSANIDGAEIDALVEARLVARQNKDFAEADRIRDALTERGIIIEDGAGGAKWRLA